MESKAPSIEQALELAYRSNPQIETIQYEASAVDSLAITHLAPDSPMIGISELNRGQKTTYGVLSQKIEFPVLSFLKASRQRKEASILRAREKQLRLSIRGKVISSYYAIYVVQRIIELAKRDLVRIQNVSRIVESKYASGKSPQHESMRAHVAQTQAETELVILKKEEESLQAKLIALLHQPQSFSLSTSERLEIPDVRQALGEVDLNDLSQSAYIGEQKRKLQRAKTDRSIAYWDLAPDFMFRYQKRISGAPSDSHIVSLEMSIPLWFWADRSRITASKERVMAAKMELSHSEHHIRSELRILRAKIFAEYELLKIFKTSLIPQALTSFNSATAAYRANKISLNDYLETERALLQVEISQYRSLGKYIDLVVKFESILGKSISGWKI